MPPDRERGPDDASTGRELPEAELIRRMQAGDRDALPLLFDRYVSILRRYARKWLPGRLRRKVSVEDVLQEARIAAFARSLEFEHRGDGSARNWLLRIVELKVREAVRRHVNTAQRTVEREVSRGDRPDTAQVAAAGHSPSEMAVAAELAELASQAMSALPPHYREVLRLARSEGLSLREIATRTGRSREAVKKLYARALSQFTEGFKRLGGDTHG